MKKGFVALILAAGRGTRFKSDTIKVLHPLLGRPMLGWVVECLSRLRPSAVLVVVGHQKAEIIQAFPAKVRFVDQKRPLGTAHAVLSAKKALLEDPDQHVLVMNGDLPLVQTSTLRPFLNQHRKQQNALTFLTAELDNPTGFGRVVRLNGGTIQIVEEKDTTPAQRRIRESNLGIYLFRAKDLFQALPKISNKNKKGEYYLTDIIEIMSRQGKKVSPSRTEQTEDFIQVNDRFELAKAVDVLRMRKIKALTDGGVTVYDPATTWVDADVRISEDTVLYPSVIIEGRSRVGKQCRLYPFVHIHDSRIGDRVKVLTSTVVESSTIEDDAQLGPFARLRPNCVILKGAKIGNFVEMKNTVFGRHSKAGHLSYIGDATVEDRVNIGAGTITCNYDGFKKSRTHIGAEVFIGSGTEIVAPVKIGKGAYVGAGSTITKDVSPGALAVSRSRQVEKLGWMARKKKK